jgi:hypothetical protein
VTVLTDRHETYRPAVMCTTILGLVLALFPIYSFALTLHPLCSLPLDSQYTTVSTLNFRLRFSALYEGRGE